MLCCCRPEDTLYLDVAGLVVRPGVLIVSDNGRTGIEFGSIGTGQQLCVLSSSCHAIALFTIKFYSPCR